MKGSAGTLRLISLVAAASFAIVVLALWAITSGGQQANANHLLKVGLDFDPSGTPADGVYISPPPPSNLPTFEDCVPVTVGGQTSIDLFVLDVERLVSFSSYLQYNGANLKVVGSFTGTTTSNPNGTLFMSSQLGSNVFNASQNSPNPLTGLLATPDTDGLYQAAAADTGNVDGDTGYGVLARITFEGVAPGVSAVSIPSLDLNGDTTLDIGTTLVSDDPIIQGGVIILNDANLDGLYDGPFTNQSGAIAVGQDNDADGLFDFNCDPNTNDNCPNDFNPDQSDIDGDGDGDVCDGDSDGDGFWNVHENAWGSDTLDAGKTPDICDDVDNDGDTTVDEGFDFTRPGGGPPNGVPDCSENVDTDGDSIPNPTDPDDDNDGTTDLIEIFIGTDTLADCPTVTGVTGHYAWMSDINNNRLVSIGDVLSFLSVFNVAAGDPRYNLRFDWTGNGIIGIADVLSVLPYFNTFCTP